MSPFELVGNNKLFVISLLSVINCHALKALVACSGLTNINWKCEIFDIVPDSNQIKLQIGSISNFIHLLKIAFKRIARTLRNFSVTRIRHKSETKKTCPKVLFK